MSHRGVLLALALAACGPSEAERRAARDALYQTDRDTVWQAMVAEIGVRYPPDYIKIEDAERGLIETKWNVVEGHITPNGARAVFRLMMKIEPGGPPWYVSVDGEAAEFRTGMSMLQPYRRGAEEEPRWVAERVSNMRAALHRRLRSYATALPVGRP
jgi:hypothetical protein